MWRDLSLDEITPFLYPQVLFENAELSGSGLSAI
jgi:hypothetical protein